jgi:hypothetical protein
VITEGVHLLTSDLDIFLSNPYHIDIYTIDVPMYRYLFG